MKAAVCTKYGPPDVLQLIKVEKPVPRDNEVLIKVRAATVTSADCKLRSLNTTAWERAVIRLVFGPRKPRQPILGMELAGDIEAVGKDVKQYKSGDPVFAYTGTKLGAYTEYICLPEGAFIVKKPAHVKYEEAATIPHGGVSALYFLRKANAHKEQKILVYGASGAVGTYAVQIAKHFGAHVTGVCSTGNQELVKSLGADCVIDYTKEDFTTNGERYDVIFDAVGKISKARCKKALAVAGVFVTVGGLDVAKVNDEILEDLIGLIADEKIEPVIDKRYPLEQIADAHRYADTGHKKGNVVIYLD